MRNPEVWIILAVLAIALFGAKKMPDAARGLGRSLRIFKAEIKGLNDDENTQQAAPQPAPQAQLPAGYQQPAPAPAYQQQPVAAPAPAATAPAPAPVAVEPSADRQDAQ